MTEITSASKPVLGALRKRMLWLSIICSYLVVSAHLPLFTDRVPDFTLMRYVVAVWRYGVGVIPVEIFFVVSGYAFFRTYQATWEGYRGKIGRRVRTLIIPYIVWICVTILYKVISGDQISGVDTLLSWFGITSGYPALYVLWYLRDLFLLCLLAPMIYFLMSRRRLAIGLLIALWCLQWVPLAGLSNLVQGLLWFPAGAFVALHISQGTLLRCRRPWVWFVGWLGM
ncbi:MAG: acyltransferase family protein, partial [Anaerolineae bacterium]|nr:acyltransferase family protein [Anaerolineae bacterium]